MPKAGAGARGDPARPRKSSSAFMFFANEARSKMKAAQPALGFGDVARELAVLWKALPDEGKAAYEALAVEDRARYSREMASYTPHAETAGAAPVAVAKPARGRRQVVPGAPMRSRSAFMFYCKQQRQPVRSANPSLSMSELTSVLAAQWRGLPAGGKSEFEAAAAADKARYAAALCSFDGVAAPAAPPADGGEGGASDDDND